MQFVSFCLRICQKAEKDQFHPFCVDEAGILAVGDKYEGLLDDAGHVPAADDTAADTAA